MLELERQPRVPPHLAEATSLGPAEAVRVVLADGGERLVAVLCAEPGAGRSQELAADAPAAEPRDDAQLEPADARRRVPAGQNDGRSRRRSVELGAQPGHPLGLPSPVEVVGDRSGLAARLLVQGHPALELAFGDLDDVDHDRENLPRPAPWPATAWSCRLAGAQPTKEVATLRRVSLTVNGSRHEVEVEPRELLVFVLRERLGLTGTNVGCDTSSCGACTVLLEGEAVKSCTVFGVQADGLEVTTIEGLASNGDLHPVQQAFHEHHALQCGYCTPGMVLTAVSLIEQRRGARRARDPRGARGKPVPLHRLPQHRQGSRGGCRREGVMATIETRAGRFVGTSAPRREDHALLTGQGTFVET